MYKESESSICASQIKTKILSEQNTKNHKLYSPLCIEDFKSNPRVNLSLIILPVVLIRTSICIVIRARIDSPSCRRLRAKEETD